MGSGALWFRGYRGLGVHRGKFFVLGVRGYEGSGVIGGWRSGVSRCRGLLGVWGQSWAYKGSWFIRARGLLRVFQGYLAHKKLCPPRNLKQDYV